MSHRDWTKLLLIQTFLQKRSVPKKSLARTSSSAKKQCAPPKATLRIRLEKWGEISGRRFAPPTIRSPKNRLVPFWCAGEDLHLHALRHMHLKHTCILFHHPRKYKYQYTVYGFLKKEKTSHRPASSFLLFFCFYSFVPFVSTASSFTSIAETTSLTTATGTNAASPFIFLRISFADFLRI